MHTMTRREFTKKSALVSTGLAASPFVACEGPSSVRNDELKVTLPMPIQMINLKHYWPKILPHLEINLYIMKIRLTLISWKPIN